MADEALFIEDGEVLLPTEFAVGPWSADTLQASAYGGLLVRALERAAVPADMTIARLSFDLWRPVTREPITTSLTVLREGRKAQTLEASLIQTGKPVARCTGVFLKADVAATPPIDCETLQIQMSPAPWFGSLVVYTSHVPSGDQRGV